MEDSANPQWIQVGNGWYWCSDWKATLILEDQATHAQSLGDLSVVRGGNFGGLFMPIAFTKDNQQIVLDAWMFSPGAGGGSVDLGYDIMPATGTVATEQKQQLVPRQAKFYDTFGEVVFLGNSKNLPGFSQPGPSSNLGTVMAEDLITGKTKLVLEEPDTTYDLLDINEAKGTLHFRATKHQFTAACPKREDALDCTKNTVAERTIPLPTF